MNRLVVCLAVIATLGLAVETASAGHGRRVVRVHHAHARVVHHVPVVHHAVVRVAPHHVHHVPRVYHAPYAYPAYGHAVVHQYGYAPARIYVGRPVISLQFGF